MSKQTSYTARKPNEHGFIDYPDEEHAIWAELYKRQTPLVALHACREYLQGLDILAFPEKEIPQLHDINQRLNTATGWSVERVPALINFKRFYDLLAHRKFPAATFIRRWDELDYLQEPDIFHELYGHCPMLTDPVYANFMQRYGEFAAKQDESYHAMLARMYWFTVEFGLVNSSQGMKIYGGGILSSIGETPYSLESTVPERRPFDPIDIFRTPYRIDILQTKYFVIDSYQQLYNLMEQDLIALIKEARRLGMHQPTYSSF